MDAAVKYITGIHALNLPCTLETCGDWHTSAIQWEKPFLRSSEDSIFGRYGIESNVSIPHHTEKFNAANHLRALLDLLELGQFTVAQGMRDDFICNDAYTEEIFSHVVKLKASPLWTKIDNFMKSEYYMQWVTYEGRPS